MSEIGGGALTDVLHANVVRGSGDQEILPHYAIKRVLRPDGASGAAGAAAGSGAGGGGVEGEVAMAGADSSAAGAALAAAGVAAPYTAGGAGAGGAGAGAGASATRGFMGAPRIIGRFEVHRRDLGGGLTPSFRVGCEMEVVDDMKRAVCMVHETGHDPAHPPAALPYELPDGTVIKLRNHRELLPEIAFRDDVYETYRAVLAPRGLLHGWGVHQHGGSECCAKRGDVPVRVRPLSLCDTCAPPFLAVNYRTPAIGLHTNTANPTPIQYMAHSALLAATPEIRRDLANNS